MTYAESHSPSDLHGSSISIAEEPVAGQPAQLEPTLVQSSNPSWLLTEEGFTLSREHEIESLFAIANGYVGNRGSLAEGSPLSAPATFMAGVFEQLDTPGSVPQLMTLPDWTGVRIWINDEPLRMDHGEVLEHRRVLDLHQGVLWREWCHRDPHGRITRIMAFRLASLIDRHLLLHSITLTAENYSAPVRFETSIEVPSNTVILPTTDWKPRRSSERPNVFPLALRAPGRGVTVAFGVTSQMFNSTNTPGMRKVAADGRRIVERCEIQAAIGAQCHLHRLISIYSSRESSQPFERAMAHLKQVLPRGIKAATFAHVSEWQSRWNTADIEVSGDNSLQRALRFAAYHLISAANPEDGRVSIGARALTGSAYKGHVFWDTEIYMLPFYIFTHPPSARALLEYRHHTLDAAREKACSAGFRGAMYPWESADTGEETTPRAVIMPTGEVIQVLNGEMEIHITADIAFAIWQYWNVTADEDFFLQFGAEIILETARFWASRGTLEPDGAYHIRHVIGPDEYHDNVDDNAYTNLMAAWNLRCGAESARLLQQRWPDRWNELASRLQLRNEEVNTWPKLAKATFTGFNSQTHIFEQFSGYFDKEPVDLNAYEPRSAAMDVILGHERIQRTNIVKQADVVMASYLLWNEISPEARIANFRYYEPRTGHGSSLSPSIHALVAARLGDTYLAQRYLKQASEIDLGNNMGNAAGGVHAAALGGLWQAMIFGFAGVRLQSDGLSFAPHQLSHWHRLAFPLQWRGRTLNVSIEPAGLQVAVKGPEGVKLYLEGGPEVMAEPEREYAIQRSNSGWGSWSAQ
jgi:trehalose/maltose hydrolase-like predicted phosphorylase